MKKIGIVRQLYRYFLVIIAIALFITTIMASETLKKFHHNQTFTDSLAKARLMEAEIISHIMGNDADVDSVSKELGKKSGTRVTVILPNGRVVGDSHEDPSTMDNHGDRPEVRQALNNQIGESIRYSYTLKTDMLYMAIPLENGGKIIGILRVSMPLNSVDYALKRIYLQFAAGGLIMAILAAFISYIISRRLSRPLRDLKEGAEHFAGGDLRYRLHIPDSEEIATLADAMNQMAIQLDESMQSLVRQRNFLDAILASMIEGVITINKDQNIININRAASELFGIPPLKQARSIQETIRNTDIHRFVQKTLSSADPTEGEITISGGKDIFLNAHGTVLRDVDGKNIGAVIVLNNITKLKRLETVRRDFVANVSHELRTPITSIKGFVETIQNGAINNREETERFLNIIARQSDRLNAIVEDLLSLSRIEQEAEKNEIVLENTVIKDVIDVAIQASAIKAAEKNIDIDLKCGEDMRVKINAPLLEQALINLLDNAIKYSEPGKKVKVEVERADSEMTISVVDEGCGISKEYLPRLFERFYRVDKARSRKLGGTGLGLSIVKHIAIAHKGRVSVESVPGKGSVFTIHLPGIVQTTK